MSFSRLMADGIRKIYEEDYDNQVHYLKAVCGVIRGRPDIQPLLEADAFFVPNRDYMLKYFGPSAENYEYDLYNLNGSCIWDNFIVFPVRNISGTIVGLAGFDALTKAKSLDGEENLTRPKYRYSRSDIFNRGNYVYMLDGVFEKSVKEGYMIITDGIFDMLYFHEENLNTGSLLGSSVNQVILFTLRFIDTLYVAYDNDAAGIDLYKYLKAHHPSVKFIRQNIGKDSDDSLKSEYRELYVKKIRDAIERKSDLVFRIKPKLSSRQTYNKVKHK